MGKGSHTYIRRLRSESVLLTALWVILESVHSQPLTQTHLLRNVKVKIMVIFILQKMVTETWGSSKALGQHPEHLSRPQWTFTDAVTACLLGTLLW